MSEAGNLVSVAPQMVFAAPEDPSSSIYGVMMFLPLAALILAGIAAISGNQDVMPSIIKFLSYGGIANINWGFILAAVLLLLVLVLSIVAAITSSRNAKSAN